MKTAFNRLFSRMSSNKGYTIDQTILIVAIIAILITLVIITVGWQLINRSSGTKAAAQLKQVEDANGQFYSSNKVWPMDALSTAGTPVTNMAVLVANGISTWATNIDQTDLRNILPGFRTSGAGTATQVFHGFDGGNGAGVITEQSNVIASLGTDTRILVQFTNVPIAAAKEADKAIDGSLDAAAGRVFYGTSACLNATKGGTSTVPAAPTAATTNVFLCYAANTVN